MKKYLVTWSKNPAAVPAPVDGSSGAIVDAESLGKAIDKALPHIGDISALIDVSAQLLSDVKLIDNAGNCNITQE